MIVMNGPFKLEDFDITYFARGFYFKHNPTGVSGEVLTKQDFFSLLPKVYGIEIIDTGNKQFENYLEIFIGKNLSSIMLDLSSEVL